MKEISECSLDKSTNVTLTQSEDDNMCLFATFIGPEETPYEGGTFRLSIYAREYPMTPPRIKFITKIYHPNISHKDGTISLDIL